MFKEHNERMTAALVLATSLSGFAPLAKMLNAEKVHTLAVTDATTPTFCHQVNQIK